jgi:hypothetical protein
MTVKIIIALFWFFAFVGFGCLFAFFAVPEILPTRRGVAARRVAALAQWDCRHPVAQIHTRARGYFDARDYIGVESAYLAGRRIVDGESAPK